MLDVRPCRRAGGHPDGGQAGWARSFCAGPRRPVSWDGPADIDSGSIIPIFNISPGSSGMAFIGASAFEDQKFLATLAATLDFAAFPSRKAGRLKYCASNQVGDAALLYAATLGPVWQKAKAATKPRAGGSHQVSSIQ